MIERVQLLEERMKELKSLRLEMRRGFAALSRDSRKKFGAVHAELKSIRIKLGGDLRELRKELAGVHKELHAHNKAIVSLENEVTRRRRDLNRR